MSEISHLESKVRSQPCLDDPRWLSAAQLSLEEIAGLQTQNLELERQVERLTQALAESEQRSVLATNAGKIGVWDWNLETNEIYLEPLLKALLGYEDWEIQNDWETWKALIHPDDRPLVDRAVKTYLDQQIPCFKIEHRMLHQDGSVRWVLSQGVALRHVNHRPYRIVGSNTDITERKRLEVAFQASDLKLRNILNSSGAVIASFRLFANCDYHYDFFSSSSETILGYSPQELTTNPKLWLSRIHPEDVETVIMPVFTQLFAGQTTTIEFRFQRKDNSWRWISSTVVSRRDEAADCWIVTCVEVDISDRKQTEVALKESEERFRSTFEQAAVGIAHCAQSGQLLRVNQKLCEIQGYPYDELMTLTWQQITHPDDIAPGLEGVRALWAGEISAYIAEKRYIRKDGSLIWAKLTLSLMYDSAGTPQFEIVVVQDISERKRVEAERRRLYQQVQALNANLERLVKTQTAELQQALEREATLKDITIAVRKSLQSHAEQLESLNHQKDEFLSTVSHELRAPMANIKMAAQMLELVLGETDTLDAQVHRYLQILKAECDRESSLINDLLDLSRVDSGKLELNLTTIQLQHWIPYVAEPFEERILKQQQQLIYCFEDGLPAIVTDSYYLQRIMAELLHNACKYTPAHEQIIITLATKKTLSTSENCISHLTIQVTNTGVEIPADQGDRIFDKFYRIASHDPWKQGGTGLGLSLIKKFVEYLSGTIQLESTQNQTTFKMIFPITPTDHEN